MQIQHLMCPKFILMVKRSLLLIQTSTWETSYQQILQTERLQKTFAIYIKEATGLLVTSEYRSISKTVFMLSIAINGAEHVYATVIIKHNYMPICAIIRPHWWSYESDRHTCHTKISMTQDILND